MKDSARSSTAPSLALKSSAPAVPKSAASLKVSASTSNPKLSSVLDSLSQIQGQLKDDNGSLNEASLSQHSLKPPLAPSKLSSSVSLQNSEVSTSWDMNRLLFLLRTQMEVQEKAVAAAVDLIQATSLKSS